MFRSRAFLVVAFVCAALTHLRAQSDAPAANAATQQSASVRSDAPTFRSTVRRVIVDVVVRDSNNKPVHGLKASDFIVAEDGHPQNILSFDVFDLDTPSISLPANAPQMPPNHFVNIPPAPEHGPLYVILYDMVNIEVDDQIDARRQVLKFIKSKPAGTRFAIFVRSDDLYLVQGFTEDKDRLYSVLDPQNPKSHVPRVFMMQRNHGLRDPVSMMNVLAQVTEFMEGVPGHKNLIWLAGTFPLSLVPRKDNPREYEDVITAEINEITRAQIAVYPINVGGVPVNPPGLMTGARPNGGSANQTVQAGGINAGGPGVNSLTGPDAVGMMESILTEKSYDSIYTDYDVQRTISDSTGGRSFYSTNDVTAALAEATDIGGNYYSLTYSPTNEKDDGGRRSIQVRLAKRGFHLDYRHFYFTGAFRPQAEPAKTKSLESEGSSATATAENDTLQPNMKHGAPMLHDLLFSAHIRPDGSPAKATADEMTQLAEQPGFADKKKDKLVPVDLQKYLVDYRVTDNALKLQGAKSPEFEFAAAAYDSESRMLNSSLSNANGDSNPDASKTGVFRARLEFSVPAAASSIRIGVRDKISNRVGTLEVQLPLAPEAPTPTPGH